MDLSGLPWPSALLPAPLPPLRPRRPPPPPLRPRRLRLLPLPPRRRHHPAPAPVVDAPEPPALATPVLRIIGPFITTDGTVSMVMGASSFLPEEDWRVFRFPSIN